MGAPQQAGGPPPGGFPQQPGPGAPGQPPGFGGPPKKSKAPWLIGGIGGGFVLLLIVIATLAFTLSGPGDPRPVATEIVDALNAKNFDKVANMTCAKDRANGSQATDPVEAMKREGIPEQQARKLVDSMDFNVTINSVQEHGDDTATAKLGGGMTASLFGQTQTEPMNEDMHLIVEDGTWVACDP